jgi:hypothetical protein
VLRRYAAVQELRTMLRDDPNPAIRPVTVLALGGGFVERRLRDPVDLLRAYREDEGTRYLNYVPITPPDELLPEDLAVTLLINSRARYRAFKSIQDLTHAGRRLSRGIDAPRSRGRRLRAV